MNKYLTVLPMICLIFAARSQTVSQRYQSWLSDTPLGDLIVAREYIEAEGQLILALRSELTSPEEVKQMYSTWDSLETSYKSLNIDLAAVLLYEFQREVTRPIDELSVRITSPIPVLFSVEIKSVNSEISCEVTYVDFKGGGPGAYITSDLFLPANVIPLDLSLDEAKSTVSNAVHSFFTEEFGLSQRSIRKLLSGNVSASYQVDHKPIFSSNMNDRVLIQIVFIPVNAQKTEVNLETRAYCAQGIVEAGEYVSISNSEYLSKLSIIQINLSNTIYSVSKE